jgi:hypothetical protein
MSMRLVRKLVSALSVLVLSSTISACIIAANARSGAYDPSFGYHYESTYGYTTTAAPGTVYYSGGYYGGVYYRPGYYAASAPFVTVYGQPQAYAQPVAQPVYGTQPVYPGGGAVVVQPGVAPAGPVARPVR